MTLNKKDQKPSQLAFPIRLSEEPTFQQFFTSDKNQILLHQLKQLHSNHFQLIFFHSNATAGKTHLLKALMREHSKAQYVSLKNMHDGASLAFNLTQCSILCLDDIQGVIGVKTWEDQLFALYHECLDRKIPLVLTANCHLLELNWTLADLKSRCSSGLIFRLHPLEDDEKVTVLINKADQRGIELTHEVGQFLIRRCPRQLHALVDALEILDQASWSQQRKITIPFIKSILQV